MTTTQTAKQLNEQYQDSYIYCKVIKEKVDNYNNTGLMVSVLKNKNSPFKTWGEHNDMATIKQRLTSQKEKNGSFTRLTEDGEYYRFLVDEMAVHMGHPYVKRMTIAPLPENLVEKLEKREKRAPVPFELSDSEDD